MALHENCLTSYNRAVPVFDKLIEIAYFYLKYPLFTIPHSL